MPELSDYMKYISQILLFVIIAYASYAGFRTYEISKEENEINYDYAEMHMIKYGLFNLDLWKEKLFVILEDRVDNFEITARDLDGIRRQIELYLQDLYEEYFESGKLIDAIVDARQGSENEKKLGKLFVGLFRKNIEAELKNIDFEAQIPVITDQLMIELERKIPEIKAEISQSVSDMMAQELASSGSDRRIPLYQKYGGKNLEEADAVIEARLGTLKASKRSFIIRSISALILSLLVLLMLNKTMPFSWSISWLTLICTVFLALGLALPMIDLDARLSTIDVTLLDSNIHFDEQVMYYQSKSIIDVTMTLLEGRGIDLKIVGLLILLFSIVLPFLKMLLTTVYLFLEKSRNSKLIKVIIFYMGKWSMADVFVVAIFMSYIGFYGLISSMLNDFSYQSYSSSADTVNYSSLSPGIIYFSSYCLLSIVMSSIVHRKFKKQELET